nr:4-(cytidine 5'-diphospho)-2-C-methyl-D-erythritol kinase [Nakamurella leprariae]
MSSPGKVNLFLGVGDRREDGYHDLVTVFHAVDLADEVALQPADRLSVRTHGVTEVVPEDGDNLAGAAITLLAQRLGREPAVAVDITKRIPVAGGMAGGSADAAAALVGCAALWGQDVPRAQLAGWAAELGSDVPFALSGGTALGTGRGERLSPVLSRAELSWVLAPAGGGGLSTPAVYTELDRLRAAGDVPRAGEVEPMLAALATGDLAGIAAEMANDLQAAAFSLRPELRRTLRAGLDAGALGGIVSGSGPTIALLCADPDHAARVATDLAGSGTVRTVRTAAGPAPGARVLGGRG